jgi:hypothetical protein
MLICNLSNALYLCVYVNKMSLRTSKKGGKTRVPLLEKLGFRHGSRELPGLLLLPPSSRPSPPHPLPILTAAEHVVGRNLANVGGGRAPTSPRSTVGGVGRVG